MNDIWLCAAGLGGATIIGSLLGFAVKNLPHRWNDTLLGYCAGVMLAASTLGLIVPAFGMESSLAGRLVVAVGVMCGLVSQCP